MSARSGCRDRMWAMMVLRLRARCPRASRCWPARCCASCGCAKAPAEVAALAEAGAAIDRVHDLVPGLLRPGRTEREVGADIAAAILAEGHARVDFTIVGSGPNAASPHHELSGRVLSRGDVVVVDIGGTMPSGYCSDSTRTYAIGAPPPSSPPTTRCCRTRRRPRARPFARDHCGGGRRCRPRPDHAGGLRPEFFIHRTGHGIGLETHEEPYIVAGNTEPLEPGMAFSVEPGIYPRRARGAHRGHRGLHRAGRGAAEQQQPRPRCRV